MLQRMPVVAEAVAEVAQTAQVATAVPNRMCGSDMLQRMPVAAEAVAEVAY